MLIRVLGCSGSIAAGSRTTSFLIDHDILIDAGTGVGDLPLDQLARIDHVFLTHSHLDHVLAVGLLADSVLRTRAAQQRPPLVVHALAPTLDALRSHLFNGVIWPDFSKLPSPDRPTLRWQAIATGERRVCAGRCIEALPAAHTVPAVGYAVWPGERPEGPAWVFTGDTGPNPALWHRLADIDVGHLVIEAAFRDDERVIAARSAHLHPAQLREELRALTHPADVYVTHIKPGEVEAVMREIRASATHHRIRALVEGEVLEVQAPVPAPPGRAAMPAALGAACAAAVLPAASATADLPAGLPVDAPTLPIPGLT